MVGCAVAICNQKSTRTDTDIRYHRFPKDLTTSRMWIACCKRKDVINIKTARMCSRHFKPEDFERNLQKELLGIPYQKALKKDALPTLYLDDTKTDNENWSKNSPPDTTVQTRKSRNEATEIRKRALERLKNLSPKRKTTHLEKECNTDFVDYEKMKLQKEANDAKYENSILKLRLKEAQRKNEVQGLKMKQLTKELKLLHKPIKKTCGGKRIENEAFKMRFTEILKKIFTKGQIKCLLKEGRRVTWVKEDIESALELKKLSNRVYKHLRAKGFPLPGLTTLQTWAKMNNSMNYSTGNNSICDETRRSSSSPMQNAPELKRLLEKQTSHQLPETEKSKRLLKIQTVFKLPKIQTAHQLPKIQTAHQLPKTETETETSNQLPKILTFPELPGHIVLISTTVPKES